MIKVALKQVFFPSIGQFVQVYHILYASSSSGLMTRDELLHLLEKSRLNNERDHITGMLLYREGNILQLIEGEESVVRDCFARISLDERHRGILILHRGFSEGRAFPDWTMAFRELGENELGDVPGFSDWLRHPSSSLERLSGDSALCRTMFDTFRRIAC